jgi:lycopene beta-cyclase
MPDPHTDYDFVIIGGGVSGLTLAHHMARGLPSDTRILLVDKDEDPDYNISFWTTRDTPFAPVMNRTWRTIEVRYGDQATVCPLTEYMLKSFWRSAFDEFVLQELGEHSNVEFLDAAVSSANDLGDHAVVETSLGSLSAAWAFDSRSGTVVRRDDDPAMMLMQGLAVEIEADAPVFDPQVATLFDFLLDTPQFDFMYVLPYSTTYALVNAAFVTPPKSTITKQTCEDAITEYVTERVGCKGFEVVKDCYGRIPLRSKSPVRRMGDRVVPIGVRGGMIKASTSYAFMRILRDSERIVAAIRARGQPYYSRQRPSYYRWADRTSARAFQRSPKQAQDLMFQMFSPENGDRALSFLDERNTLRENLSLFRGVSATTLARFMMELAAATLIAPNSS